MIILLQILMTAAAFTFDYSISIYLPCIIPIIYILIMAPGTFWGGSNINIDMLRSRLDPIWAHADELAVYMKKYWYSLIYVMSANARQKNCFDLSLFALATSFYYFYISGPVPIAITLLGCSITLYYMSMRVNRALGIFNDSSIRTRIISTKNDSLYLEWSLAATSLVAISDLFPENQNYKLLSQRVLADDLGLSIVNTLRMRY